MADLLTLGTHLVRLARLGLRTFVRTLLIVVLAGIALAAASSYFLRDYSGFYRFLAVALVMMEASFIAFTLAGRRSVSLTLAEGLTSMKLGSSLVRLVFDRLPGSAQKPAGAQLAPGLQRLAPGEAERLLSNATDDVQSQTQLSSGIKQRIQSQLLDLVRKYSLLRIQSAPGKEIDMQAVRQELEETIDARLADKMRDSARFWTLLVVVGFPLVVAAQTLILMSFAKSANP